MQRPRLRIPAVDVVPDFQFFPCQSNGLRQIHAMVSIENRQLAIVNRLIQRAQPRYVLDQIVLLLGAGGIADSAQYIAQRRSIGGQRYRGQCLLILFR